MLTHDDEVDFILKKHGDNTAAIEVKSGRRKGNRGLGVFEKNFHPQASMVVGSDALPLELFLSITPDKLFWQQPKEFKRPHPGLLETVCADRSAPQS